MVTKHKHSRQLKKNLDCYKFFCCIVFFFLCRQETLCSSISIVSATSHTLCARTSNYCFNKISMGQVQKIDPRAYPIDICVHHQNLIIFYITNNPLSSKSSSFVIPDVPAGLLIGSVVSIC